MSTPAVATPRKVMDLFPTTPEDTSSSKPTHLLLADPPSSLPLLPSNSPTLMPASLSTSSSPVQKPDPLFRRERRRRSTSFSSPSPPHRTNHEDDLLAISSVVDSETETEAEAYIEYEIESFESDDTGNAKQHHAKGSSAMRSESERSHCDSHCHSRSMTERSTWSGFPVRSGTWVGEIARNEESVLISTYAPSHVQRSVESVQKTRCSCGCRGFLSLLASPRASSGASIRRRAVALAVTLGIVVVTGFFWMTLNILGPSKGCVEEWITPALFISILGVSTFLFLVQFVVCVVVLLPCVSRSLLKTNLVVEIISFTFNLTLLAWLLSMFFATRRSSFRGSHNLIILMIPIFALIFSLNWFIVFFWFHLVIICMIVSFVVEYLSPNLIENRLIEYEETKFFSQFGLYTAISLPYLIALAAFLLLLIWTENDHRLLLRTATAISTLRFDDEVVIALLKKPVDGCSSTELVLRQIIMNMEQYARFLPEHLKKQKDVEEVTEEKEGGGGGGDEIKNTARTTAAAEQLGGGDVRSRSSSDVESFDTEGTIDSGITSNPKSLTGPTTPSKNPRNGIMHAVATPSSYGLKNRAAFAVGLWRRMITILVVDIRDTLAHFAGDRVDSFVRSFNDASDSLLRLCLRYGGTFDGIVGDKLIVSFNSCRTVVTHQFNAVRCATEFIAQLSRTTSSEGEAKTPLRAIVSIASGPAIVGDLGNEIRRSVTIGNACSRAFVMKHSLIVPIPDDSTDSYVYVDENVMQMISYSFDTKLVSTLRCHGQQMRIYRLGDRLVSEVSRHVNEWMYQLGSQLEEGSESDKQLMEFRSRWHELWSLVETSSSLSSRTELECGLRDLVSDFDGLECFSGLERSDALSLLRRIREMSEFSLVADG